MKVTSDKKRTLTPAVLINGEMHKGTSHHSAWVSAGDVGESEVIKIFVADNGARLDRPAAMVYAREHGIIAGFDNYFSLESWMLSRSSIGDTE